LSASAIDRSYLADHALSISDPDAYWSEIAANNYHWEKSFDASKVLKYNFHASKGPIHIEWFKGGKTNISYNAVDRWAEDTPEKIALIFEGNDPSETASYTFKELKAIVCRVANVLKSKGVKKGDRVALYLPMTVDLPISMLACARIGAVHSVVFGGFSSDALAARIKDSGSKVLITADGVGRGEKVINLKSIADTAMDSLGAEDQVETCLVLERLNEEQLKDNPTASHRDPSRDVDFAAACAAVSDDCPVTWMDAEDPLFILYTSGSTGTPKGVLHTTGGYMVYSGETFRNVFDYKGAPSDVFWCTADCGWITGHSYLAYGPLLSGCTSVVFEGVPNYPDASRFWSTVERHKVTQFYTAPTALRALMREGDEPVKKHDLSSLRILGTVGEPINPAAWDWYNEIVGKGNCPIVDTWWQTETGGHMLTPLPNKWPLKPGSATLPFYGVAPALIDPSSEEELEGNGVHGHLCMKQPWPGMARSLWNNHERFEEVYFSQFDGYYCTGDGAQRDEDGYFWVTGRVDDVLIVSGHNIGTAEVESSFVGHGDVAEAAVVGFPHEVKGEAIYCYVTLNQGVEGSEDLRWELKKKVAEELGAFCRPDVVHFTPALPKTRSGKIMRRILRKIADPSETDKLLAGDLECLGDISTLADEAIVHDLVEGLREPC